MKRIFCAAMAFLILFSLCGCSNSAPQSTIFSRDDVEGSVIGVLSNTAAGAYAATRGEVRYYESREELVAALKAGTVDCAVADVSTAPSLVKHQRKLMLLDEPLISAGFCFAVAKENADLTSDINSALSQLAASGTLQRITDNYFSKSSYSYESTLNTENSAGTLTLAVGSDFPPYKTTLEDGSFAGLDIDVARAVCDILGLDLEIKVITGESLISAVMYGRAHFALGGLYASDTNLEKVDFSDPYTTCTQMIITRK